VINLEFPLNVDGFEGHSLVLHSSNFFSGPKLTFDGSVLPKGQKRGQFILKRNDGAEVTVELKVVNFLDPVPQVYIGGIHIEAAPPLQWYEVLVCCLPIMLILGGALGGALGAGSSMLNMFIFRTSLPIYLKYTIAIVVLAAASMVWLVAAAALNLVFHHR